jgi:hypothetical protein
MGLKMRALAALLIATCAAGGAIGAPAATAADQGAGACRAPDKPIPESQRKFHPGHYVSVGRAELPNGIATVVSKGVVGVQMRYRWADLEPARDQYQFAAIARDLEAARKAGVQLVVLVEDKSFNGEQPTPGYLQSKTVQNHNRGYTALRWDPFVGDRLKQLVAKLGAQFDCDPNFEGLGFQETSPSLDEQALAATGYTPEKYRDALIGLLRSAAASLPRSRVFWYMNFLPGNQRYIGEIADSVIGTGVVMGGPDVLPDNRALEKRVYPYYEEYRGKLRLFCSMQHNSFRHRHGDTGGGGGGRGHGGGGRRFGMNGGGGGVEEEPAGGGTGGYWSMDDLFQFARDKLHVDYLFWDYHTQRNPPDSHDWNDARAVIERNPSFNR